MKKLTSIAIAFLLVLSVVPAMAADQANSNREPVSHTDTSRSAVYCNASVGGM
jgi:hypothetical protein